MSQKEKKLVLILVIILIVIDQIIKIIYINSQELSIIENEENGTYILTNLIAIIVMISYISRDNNFIKTSTRILISMIISGAISNLIDRIWLKEIVNYIYIPYFLQFNLAYIYIVIGWIGIAVILTKNTFKIIRKRNIEDENKKHKS